MTEVSVLKNEAQKEKEQCGVYEKDVEKASECWFVSHKSPKLFKRALKQEKSR